MYRVENGTNGVQSFIEANYQQYFPDTSLQQALASHVTAAINTDQVQISNENSVVSEAQDVGSKSLRGQSRKRSSAAKSTRASQHPDFPRPYPCGVCGKRFILAHHLVSHSITHTGLRPYSCNLCESRFTQISSLKRHQNKIHNVTLPDGNNTYQMQQKSTIKPEVPSEVTLMGRTRPVCNTCGKSFKTKFTLTRHQPICPGAQTLRPGGDSLVSDGNTVAQGSGGSVISQSLGGTYPVSVNDALKTLRQIEHLAGQANNKSLVNSSDLGNSNPECLQSVSREFVQHGAMRRAMRERSGLDGLHAELNESDVDDGEQNAFDHSSNENDLTEIDSLVVDALKECSKANNNLAVTFTSTIDPNQLSQSDINMIQMIKGGLVNARELVSYGTTNQSQVLPSLPNFEQNFRPRTELQNGVTDNAVMVNNDDIKPSQQMNNIQSSIYQSNVAAAAASITAKQNSDVLAQGSGGRRSGRRRVGVGVVNSGKRICPEDSKDRPYRCRECNWSFRLQHHLTNHMSTHSGARPYTCYSCSRAFAQISSLKRHVDNHCPAAAAARDTARLGCVMCDRTFNNTRALKQHVKIDHNFSVTAGTSGIDPVVQ